ncbi:hypothetical protein ACEQ8H_007808 [Pleosporales sp. CAS-2024a]
MTGRCTSPALSERSELTIFSTSPSPVQHYDASKHRMSAGCETRGYLENEKKLREEAGRFILETPKRARSPHKRPSKKARPASVPVSPPTPRRRHQHLTRPLSPVPEPGSPLLSNTAEGGFGTLGVLPREIRQCIYAYTLDVKYQPVTVKRCCGPDATPRALGLCRKHSNRITSGRFSILHVSKDIHSEASWVLYHQGSLLIHVDRALGSYLHHGRSSRSLRHLGPLATKNSRKKIMWIAASRFRYITVRLPPSQLEMGDAADYTSRLVDVACLLANGCEASASLCTNHVLMTSPSHYIYFDLGTIFHTLLPFNLPSQSEDDYERLLDWLSVNYPAEEPDLDNIAARSQYNLMRLARVIGMPQGQVQWTVGARTAVAKENAGGAAALCALQMSCARNGVLFERSS